MSEDVEASIRDHSVPGTSRRWESAGVRPWDRCTVVVGGLDDGRWYVERWFHPTTGPGRAQAYSSETEALEVAQRVMADAAAKLDGRPFVEIQAAD
jgi:hypothetical protein